MRNIVRRLQLVLPFFLLLVLCLARAEGGIPESALSRGSLIRPELLDSEGQVYLFPERAATFESEIFAMNTGGYNSVTVGGIGRVGRFGFFLLGEPTPEGISGSSQYYQGGAAIEAGGIRIGVALRGSYGTSRQSSMSHYEYADRESYDQTESGSDKKTLEGAVGLGLRTGRGSFDLSLARRSQTLDSRWWTFEADRDLSSYTESEEEVRLKAKIDPVWETAVRFSIAIADRSEFAVFGSYERPEYLVSGNSSWDPADAPLDENERGYIWSGGAAVAFPTEFFDRVTISALMGDTEWVDPAPNSYYQVVRQQYRRAWFGASVERKMIRNLTARAGVEVRYVRHSYLRQRDSELDTWVNTERSESFGEGYSWGVSYRWRNVRLHGVVSADLSLSNTFSAVDAQYFF